MTFMTYALSHLHSPDPEDRLTPSKVFVSLSLFNVLRFPLILLPMLVTMLLEVLYITHLQASRLSGALFSLLAGQCLCETTWLVLERRGAGSQLCPVETRTSHRQVHSPTCLLVQMEGLAFCISGFTFNHYRK